MTQKIKWVVDPKPTGSYASFQSRMWPSAEDANSGSPMFRVDCEEEYTPVKARTNDHGPLTLFIAYRATSTNSFEWRRVVRKFDTLDELKRHAAQMYKANPSWFEQKTDENNHST